MLDKPEAMLKRRQSSGLSPPSRPHSQHVTRPQM
uniref:Uncharacterized protein n=1 Tax=Brassica oleracea TaxID=3712 RepID=A0A3P6CCK7_BRAOL|nr:unnamed protein product [Brassica oleracea]